MKLTLYNLLDLFKDQDADLAGEVIPPLVAFLFKHRIAIFTVHDNTWQPVEQLKILFSISDYHTLPIHLKRAIKNNIKGKTIYREQIVEKAGFGLGMIMGTINSLPKIIQINFYTAPDLILSVSSSSVEGIECACRSTGGLSEVRTVVRGPLKKKSKTRSRKKSEGKHFQLLNMANISSCWLSVWEGNKSLSYWDKVK